MANNLGSLVVSLGLDAAEFTRGLSKSEYQAQQFSRRISNEVAAGVVKATAAIKAWETVIVDTVSAFVVKLPEAAAEFQDLAEKMGDTAQEVASLKLALDLSGTSADTAAAASVKLTTALSKTDDESKSVGAALKAIGLEMDEFKRLTPVAQIDAVSKALAGFEDGAGKTAVAVALFGKSGADLLPMLNDLADAGGRQITLTQQQIQGADEYSKSTARLRSEVQTLAMVTAADAAPIMEQMVQILRDTMFYSANAADGVTLLESSMRGVKTALEAVLVVGSDVAYVFKTIGDTAGAYAAVSAALIRGDVDGAKAIGAAYREISAERRKALDGYQSSVMGVGVSYPQASYSNEGRNFDPQSKKINTMGLVVGGGKNSKSDKSKTDKFTDLTYDQQVAQRVGKLFEESDITKAKEYSDALALLDKMYFELGIGADQYDAALRKLTGIQAKAGDVSKELSANERHVSEEMNRLAELLAATKSAGIEQQRRDMVLLTNSLQDGLITEAEYLESVSARLGIVEKATDTASDQAKRLGDAFSSTFGRAFDEGMKLGDLLKKLAFDAINIQFLTPATQKAGNWLGSAVSSAFGGFFADGGYLAPGKWGIAGERGPEPIFGGKTGMTIQPNGSSGGGSVVINQSISIGGNATADTVAQLNAAAARIKAETLAAVPAAVLQARRTSPNFAASLRGA